MRGIVARIAARKASSGIAAANAWPPQMAENVPVSIRHQSEMKEGGVAWRNKRERREA